MDLKYLPKYLIGYVKQAPLANAACHPLPDYVIVYNPEGYNLIKSEE
jgi:hypothetical protein